MNHAAHEHAWQFYEGVSVSGGPLDMRQFGGSARQDGWELWCCLGCDQWGFADTEAHLLRILSIEEVEKMDREFYAIAPLPRKGSR